MKILTLWQPWATLIALGIKVHETRSWSTQYRGPLAIHSAKRKMDRAGRRLLMEIVGGHAIRPGSPLLRMPYGSIVAIANLVDVYPTDDVETTDTDWACGDFTPGRYAWLIEDALQCQATCKGAQGLRDIPPDVALSLKARGLWR